MSQEFLQPNSEESDRVRVLRTCEMRTLVKQFLGSDDPLGNLTFECNRLFEVTNDEIANQELLSLIGILMNEESTEEFEKNFIFSEQGDTVEIRVFDKQGRPVKSQVLSFELIEDLEELYAVVEQEFNFYYFDSPEGKVCLELCSDKEGKIISEALYHERFATLDEDSRYDRTYLYLDRRVDEDQPYPELQVIRDGHIEGYNIQELQFYRFIDEDWREETHKITGIGFNDEIQGDFEIVYRREDHMVNLYWVVEGKQAKTVYSEQLIINNRSTSEKYFPVEELVNFLGSSWFGLNRQGTEYVAGCKVEITNHGRIFNPVLVNYCKKEITAEIMNPQGEWGAQTEDGRTPVALVGRFVCEDDTNINLLAVLLDEDGSISNSIYGNENDFFPRKTISSRSPYAISTGPGFVM